jgi:uncharacterized protein YggT (Ycf19 family)
MSELLCIAMRLYIFLFLLRLVLSFFPLQEGSTGDSVRSLAYLSTEPVVRPIRARVPPLPGALGGFGIAELLVLIALQLVSGLVCAL